MSPTPGVEYRVLAIHGYTFAPGQLPALARLRPLRHLDLQVVGVHQVLRRDAEAPGGHLLDRRTAEVAVGVGGEAIGVLAAFTGVGLAADPVHRDGEVLVRLGRDRAVGHRAGGEALDDLADRLDLVDRHGRARALAQLEQAAQRGEARRLRVDQRRVLLVDVVALGARRVLELEHRLRVEQVVLALAAPLVLAAEVEVAVRPLVGPLARTRPRGGAPPPLRSRRDRCRRDATPCR